MSVRVECILVAMVCAVTVSNASVEISGPVSGTWHPTQTYELVGATWVSEDSSLTVLPGVHIHYEIPCMFTVYGHCSMVGTETDSILITGDPLAYLPELRFEGAAASGEVAYCRFEDGGARLTFTEMETPFSVTNSSFLRATQLALIASRSDSVFIADCVFEDNGYGIGGVIDCYMSITRSRFRNNNESIWLLMSSGTISYCAFEDDRYHGVFLQASTGAEVFRCSFAGNGIGVRADDTSGPISIHSNTYYRNHWGVVAHTALLDTLTYCDFWANEYGYVDGDGIPVGVGEVLTTNANGDSSDCHFNIFMDPCLVSGTFELEAGSPCIDAGHPGARYFDPDATIADIGVDYFHQEFSKVRELTGENTSITWHVWNPTTLQGQLKLEFARPIRGALNLFDFEGREVGHLRERSFPAGTTTLEWRDDLDWRGSPIGGVVILRFRGSGIVTSRKIVILH